MTHTSEHERILEAFTAGFLNLDSPEVVSLIDGCVRCREEIEAVSSLKDDLDRTGELRQRTLESAEAQTEAVPAYHEKTVREFLAGGATSSAEGARASIAPRPPTSHPSRRRFTVRLLSAAAGILLLVTGAWFGGLFDRGTPTIMGGSIELLTPVGAEADFSLFRWKHPEATGTGYYRVLVWPEGGPPFETHTPLTQPEWIPAAGEVEGWTAIEWQVLFIEGGEEIERSKRGSARSR